MEIINQNNIYLQMNLTKHYKSQFILIAILAITGFNISLSACHFKDYKNPSISSPSGNFKISTIVNRTNKNSADYAIIIIRLSDKNNRKLADINTGAGDAQKWAVGWTSSGDTIVLQSSDIGNKAWIINNGKPVQINMTKQLNQRAEWLKSLKYI